MDVINAIETRASTRAFLDQPVDKATVNKILQTARWAPSSTNTQPWQVAVLTGAKKQHLCNKLLAACKAEQPKNPDYPHYPDSWTEPYKSRRFTCGMALYGALGIKREDTEKRIAAWQRNYSAFDAPVVLLLFIDQHMPPGSWFDYGMFCQNIMLTALEYGLATCPQATMSDYPDIVRAELDNKFDEKFLICGIALGYPDTQAKVNNYRTERESVDGFTQWYCK